MTKAKLIEIMNAAPDDAEIFIIPKDYGEIPIIKIYCSHSGYNKQTGYFDKAIIVIEIENYG